jgi:bacillithiol synthase
MKSECIDYRDLPGQNPLFLAYMYDFDRVSTFYSPLPDSAEAWRNRVRTVLDSPRFSRERLLTTLDGFNRELAGSEETLRNLDRLGRRDTIAVVTGQQVGLLGGPGFAAYKAATAVQLVRRLRDLGFSAVPIFWLAADDSDFDEVRTTHFFNGADLVRVDHPDNRLRPGQMAGTVRLAAPEAWLAPAEGVLESGPHWEGLRRDLLADWASGRSFREAFGRWMSRVFKDYGLVFFDPLASGYRRELGSFYRTAIERRSELREASGRRRAALEKAGFPIQVRVDEAETFLFLIRGEERFKLEFKAGEYRPKGLKRLRFSPEELADAVEAGSVAVSPNVLLRPILQDYLFPTAASVAGPSEVAYYSQVNALAPFWGLETVVYPRAAFTVVDRKSQRLLRRYRLAVEEVLASHPDALAERILRHEEAGRILGGFDALKSCVGEQVENLRREVSARDLSVAEMLDKAERKIRYQIDKVSQRFVANQRDHHEHYRRHISHLKNHLLPNDKLQERVLNFSYMLSEGGPDFLGELVGMIQPDCPSHRVLYL